MSAPLRATNEQIVDAYRETGSIWKAGKQLGLAGQSVHERLVAIGHPIAGRSWTAEEESELLELLTRGVTVAEAARRLGRTFNGVAVKASRQGIRVARNHEVKLPRGAGYDKVSTLRHVAALERSGVPVTRYARTHGLSVEPFVQALQRYAPARWEIYLKAHSELPERECPYCHRIFIPMNGKQIYCKRKCAADARADRSYFGGNRRRTIGLDAGICQICGRKNPKGLSSHHVFGRENDLDGEALIALCRGCHRLVTSLAASPRVLDDESGIEGLLAFAWLRRHGAKDLPPGHGIRVIVEFDIEPDEEPPPDQTSIYDEIVTHAEEAYEKSEAKT
jgi:5-methylcytosine-specific restriction endonuclease McrA